MKNYLNAAPNATVAPEINETREEARLRNKVLAASLCANCKNLEDCVYALRATTPIIECELHECAPVSVPNLALITDRQGSDSESSGAHEDPPLGLCINCENLPHCRLPKHPGGVWHCEEYK